MRTKELQESIIQKIRQTNDDELLNYLNQLLSNEAEQATYKLSAFEKNMLAESEADYLAGKTLSNKEVQATLFNRILGISNEAALSEMITLIDQKDETIFYTTPEQKTAIKNGQDQIANGQCISDECVQKEMDEWLSKE